MKNLLYGLIAMVLFSFNGNAQDAPKEQRESVFMSVKSDNELIKYKFNSIKDLEENSDEILDDITVNAKNDKQDKSEITIELSITVNTGISETTLTASLTTTNVNIALDVKKLRAKLIAAITS